LGLLQLDALEIREIQQCILEKCSLQVSTRELGMAEIHVAQVKRWICRQIDSSSKNCHDRLYVRSSYLQLRPSVAAIAQVSERVLADVGREDLGDHKARIAVGCLLSDALQPIDATKPLLHLAAPKLVDGAGEALGDLALTSQRELLSELLPVVPELIAVVLELLPGNEDPGERSQPDHPLDQGRTNAIHGARALVS
jgi:hypothetical protein